MTTTQKVTTADGPCTAAGVHYRLGLVRGGLDLLGVCRHGNYGTCLLVRERTEGVLYALKRIPIGNGKKEESKAALREAQVCGLPRIMIFVIRRWAVRTAILTTGARDRCCPR